MSALLCTYETLFSPRETAAQLDRPVTASPQHGCFYCLREAVETIRNLPFHAFCR
jgi:hypothetical protein